jgi:hypothetical protein
MMKKLNISEAVRLGSSKKNERELVEYKGMFKVDKLDKDDIVLSMSVAGIQAETMKSYFKEIGFDNSRVSKDMIVALIENRDVILTRNFMFQS